jgi:hypothetical protein
VKKAKPKSNLKKRLLIIFGAFAAVAVIGVAVFVAYRVGAGNRTEQEPIVQVIERDRAPRAAQGGRGVVITPDNMDEVQVGRQISRYALHFTTNMNTNWVFPNGSTQASSTASVGNSTFNHYTVYFDVVLADTGEFIFASPYLPVGAVIDYFALDVDLPRGVHNAIAIFHLVDEYFEEISDVSVAVTLHVE